ncbi:SagB family peptide dehydrogenase [Nostoc sp. DSM 114167]|jgi:SagB-type dehydrogenase family enzyme|uniref:SagB family peptide dehydrogenase n=1 Tax=Nostoc sp. DSM 114167 TaxID=3439050 RepID=UPI0040453061
MPSELLVSLRKDIAAIAPPEDCYIILEFEDRRLTFKNPKPGLRTALKTLATVPTPPSQLKNIVWESDGFEGWQKFNLYLKKLANLGWLCYSIVVDDVAIATAVPISPDLQISPEPISTTSKYVLSHFAYTHQIAGETILESSLSFCQIRLDWRGAALIALLSNPQNIYELSSQIPGISVDIAEQFISLLFTSQMLSIVDENGVIAEDENLTLAQWEFHDLLFHTRSRAGRHANPFGGTYRFVGKIEPLPVLKPLISNDLIDLYKPDLTALAETDISLTQVLEARKSIRQWGQPITVEQLGEFLYRTARVKNIIKHDLVQLSQRAYPGGGAIYELEIYPVINRCQNLASGLYHYQPLSHQLSHLTDKNELVEALLQNAASSMGVEEIPQILLVISARFQRLTWKYQSMAYALILKHVGVLYQNFYLVATAMNLAPCAIGAGNADLFAKAVGCDYYAESSVGEFVLGSRPVNS